MRGAFGAEEQTTLNLGRDEEFIKMCADWHVARAQQKLNWSQNDAATMFGSRGLGTVNTEPLERMKKLEEILAEVKPRTVLLAQQMLGIAATILSHDERDSVMAEGPILQIVRNVTKALDYCKADAKVGSARFED